jgi:hypothetical protein
MDASDGEVENVVESNRCTISPVSELYQPVKVLPGRENLKDPSSNDATDPKRATSNVVSIMFSHSACANSLTRQTMKSHSWSPHVKSCPCICPNILRDVFQRLGTLHFDHDPVWCDTVGRGT